jgi:hypothetical protein
MTMAGKATACVCIFSTLFVGCYSHTTLTADSPKSESEVKFQLKDGAYVRSENYERVENGYRVVGTKVGVQELEQEQWPDGTAFSGILLDTQIKEVVVTEFDWGQTVLTVVGVLVVIAGIAFLIYTSEMRGAFN